MKMNKENLDHHLLGTTALLWTMTLHTDQKNLWDLKLTFLTCIKR